MTNIFLPSADLRPEEYSEPNQRTFQHDSSLLPQKEAQQLFPIADSFELESHVRGIPISSSEQDASATLYVSVPAILI